MNPVKHLTLLEVGREHLKGNSVSQYMELFTPCMNNIPLIHLASPTLSAVLENINKSEAVTSVFGELKYNTILSQITKNGRFRRTSDTGIEFSIYRDTVDLHKLLGI